MDKIEIKRQMMELWKNVFHDSDEYVNLIFDSYFNDKLIEYEIVDGKIVAALLAIDYEFVKSIGRKNDNNLSVSRCEKMSECDDSVKENYSLRGLYLCGLSTLPEYRSRGIMSKLIEKINHKAYDLGYDFTFLIPASESLQLYYNKFGYVNCIRRNGCRFVNGYDFYNHYIDVNKREYGGKNNKIIDNVIVLETVKDIESISLLELEKICSYICLSDMSALCNMENINYEYTLVHTVFDSKVVINECIVSGGRVLIFKNKSYIIGVLLFNENNDGEIVIPHIYCNSSIVKIEMLNFISHKYNDKEIVLYEYISEEGRGEIWQPFYIDDDQSGVEGLVDWRSEMVANEEQFGKNYGMMRILRGSEILKFASNFSNVFKYSILVKDNYSEFNDYFECKNGVFVSRKVAEEEEKELLKDGAIYLTYPELTALLTRKMSNNDVVEMAMGLPRIIFNMAYLLD